MPGQTNLSPREREVAELLAQRYTNEEIARELVISIRTVEWHVGNVLAKLGVASRRELGKSLENP
ncbi:MAG TPA: helix-turn-helix transcriptional regulator [Tepidiformaceae bacterium]|nr:helix-turn-helix transcriptional regulator [Tepidiformaceae bacterium]